MDQVTNDNAATMNIREMLIHWLGGCTEEEGVESDNNSYMIGRWSAFFSAKKKADQLYGLPAEEWCAQMYEYLEQSVGDTEKS